MGLQQDIHDQRATFISDFNSKKGNGSRKSEIASLWGAFKSTVNTLKTTAQGEGDTHAEILLAALADELQAAKDDLTGNPNNWDDNKIVEYQRHWLHLLLGVNPYTTDPTHWEPITDLN